MRVETLYMLSTVSAIMVKTMTLRRANGTASPVMTCESTSEVMRNTIPQVSPVPCRMAELRLTTAPVS